MIKVYQAPKELFIDAIMAIGPRQVQFASYHFNKYDLVAEVDTNNLEQAFMSTNSIDDGWWNNENVTPKFSAEGCRSTSCGDVVVRDDEKFAVVSIGFMKI